jgi:hypothetical protein
VKVIELSFLMISFAIKDESMMLLAISSFPLDIVYLCYFLISVDTQPISEEFN